MKRPVDPHLMHILTYPRLTLGCNLSYISKLSPLSKAYPNRVELSKVYTNRIHSSFTRNLTPEIAKKTIQKIKRTHFQ